MVRLKGADECRFVRNIEVSIPYGTIKSSEPYSCAPRANGFQFHMVRLKAGGHPPARLRGERFNSIWYD